MMHSYIFCIFDIFFSENRYKSKCKKLEKECERLQDNVDKLNEKNDALVKDCHASKSQANNGECF